jgi:hypothetical protein
VLVVELLFQFADQSALDLLELLVEAERNEDDNSLAVVGEGDFTGGGNVEVVQLSAERKEKENKKKVSLVVNVNVRMGLWCFKSKHMKPKSSKQQEMKREPQGKA